MDPQRAVALVALPFILFGLVSSIVLLIRAYQLGSYQSFFKRAIDERRVREASLLALPDDKARLDYLREESLDDTS